MIRCWWMLLFLKTIIKLRVIIIRYLIYIFSRIIKMWILVIIDIILVLLIFSRNLVILQEIMHIYRRAFSWSINTEKFLIIITTVFFKLSFDPLLKINIFNNHWSSRSCCRWISNWICYIIFFLIIIFLFFFLKFF